MYIEITIEKLNDLLFDREIDHQQSERWQFLAYDSQNKVFIAADNRSHDFFIEEFRTRDEAVKWLNED